MQRKTLTAAALFGMLAVILGAFGAHALKELLPADRLASYQTGVTYQFYHALALFGIGISMGKQPSKLLTRAAWCFIVGILCFSGSIYLLATSKDIAALSFLSGIRPVLGPITPIGGLFFIVGWFLLLLHARKQAA